MMKKQRIAVIFGGNSPEYGVSLQSAHAVISHIDQSRYQPVLIGIDPAGQWFHYSGPLDAIAGDTWRGGPCTPAGVSLNPKDHALLFFGEQGVERCPVDAAFPVLHGRNGEDGSVQGLVQLAGIPLVGCGVLSSALCMDKDRAHALVKAAGVEVPKSFLVAKGVAQSQALAQAEALGYPLFVKPLRAGSSYGITQVTEAQAFPEALALAFAYDQQVIVEEAIPGFEVGCAVMGSQVLTVGEPDEIELSQGFFNFTEKYTLKTSAIHVPARISPELTRRVKETAQVIYRALDCQGFARVDVFVEPSGRIVFNEVNTIPGFTAHSRYPKMMQEAGIPFSVLITRLIQEVVGE